MAFCADTREDNYSITPPTSMGNLEAVCRRVLNSALVLAASWRKLRITIRAEQTKVLGPIVERIAVLVIENGHERLIVPS